MITQESLENGTSATDAAAATDFLGSVGGTMSLLVIIAVLVIAAVVLIPFIKNFFGTAAETTTRSASTYRNYTYN